MLRPNDSTDGAAVTKEVQKGMESSTQPEGAELASVEAVSLKST